MNSLPVEKNKLPETKVDIDLLREEMVKSIYVLEHALFTQAGYEHNRLQRMRELGSKLEEEIFDESTLAQLDPVTKIKIYSLLQNNMNQSLNFLQNLHKNVTSGIDTLNSLEKLKSQQKQNSEVKVSMSQDKIKVDHVKNLIEKHIRHRIDKDNV